MAKASVPSFNEPTAEPLFAADRYRCVSPPEDAVCQDGAERHLRSPMSKKRTRGLDSIPLCCPFTKRFSHATSSWFGGVVESSTPESEPPYGAPTSPALPVPWCVLGSITSSL